MYNQPAGKTGVTKRERVVHRAGMVKLIPFPGLGLHIKTRQSVAVQRDGASRLAKKIPIAALPKCIFELFLLQKWP